MSRIYSKQNLSNDLARLGEKLGRVPRPKDLSSPEAKECWMASKSTYYRWFGTWENALVYAGFVSNEEESTTENEVKDSPWSPENAKLVNCFGNMMVAFPGDNEGMRLLESRGTAMFFRENVLRPRAETILANTIGETPVYAHGEVRTLHLVNNEGVSELFPAPKKGVYYLVSKSFADAAKAFGRNTDDLLYPVKYSMARDSEYMIIHSLGMLPSRTLWLRHR